MLTPNRYSGLTYSQSPLTSSYPMKTHSPYHYTPKQQEDYGSTSPFRKYVTSSAQNPQSSYNTNNFRTNLAYFNPKTHHNDVLNKVVTTSYSLEGFLQQNNQTYHGITENNAYKSSYISIKSLLLPEDQQKPQLRSNLSELFYNNLCDDLSKLISRYHTENKLDETQRKLDDIINFLILFQTNIDPKFRYDEKQQYTKEQANNKNSNEISKTDRIQELDSHQSSQHNPSYILSSRNIIHQKESQLYIHPESLDHLQNSQSQQQSYNHPERQNDVKNSRSNQQSYNHPERQNDVKNSRSNQQSQHHPERQDNFNNSKSQQQSQHHVEGQGVKKQNIHNNQSPSIEYPILNYSQKHGDDDHSLSHSRIVHLNQDTGPIWSMEQELLNESPVKKDDNTAFSSSTILDDFKNKPTSLNEEIRNLINSEKDIANQNFHIQMSYKTQKSQQ